MNSILKIIDGFAIDESISNYETYSFYPITGMQLNNPGSITITIQNLDNWYHIANSWLEFEGQLKTASSYAPTDLITIANNRSLYLLNSMNIFYPQRNF